MRNADVLGPNLYDPDFRVCCLGCGEPIEGSDSGMGDEAPDRCVKCAGEDHDGAPDAPMPEAQTERLPRETNADVVGGCLR